MTDGYELYGYAAVLHGNVLGAGRSASGMLRALSTDDIHRQYITIPCTRRAFDAIKAGRTRIDGGNLFIARDGALDAPKRPVGRPVKGEPATEAFSMKLPSRLRARLRARAGQDQCTEAEVFRRALEAFLEPPGTRERGLLRKLSKGE